MFVENLCELFSTYFPDFWHLSQDYFGGKLPVKPNLSKQVDMKVSPESRIVNEFNLFVHTHACSKLQKSVVCNYE